MPEYYIVLSTIRSKRLAGLPLQLMIKVFAASRQTPAHPPIRRCIVGVGLSRDVVLIGAGAEERHVGQSSDQQAEAIYFEARRLDESQAAVHLERYPSAEAGTFEPKQSSSSNDSNVRNIMRLPIASRQWCHDRHVQLALRPAAV